MAEVHIIGQLLGATGFNSQNLFCKWGIVAGRNWELLEGNDQGQTHLDEAEDGEMVIWSHPLDVHFATCGLVGWPKIHFQIWSQDSYGRNDIMGYGFCHVPTTPGTHELSCATWVPEGSLGEKIRSFFLGGNPRLRAEEVVFTPQDRYRLRTTTSGLVHLSLSLMFKDFGKNHVQTG
uniref:B9 domain-containing protein 2 n=1 Tax=Polytomella parva TaxID=51329 RepID=A0A7S0VBP4_9CHLO|mmetsp:Transcript_3233/g.5335  ORF Transcript_3233/g.5335 Transcript_3233/m.5335 type:complete len:177 (+) Transcript_3233:142-672(+)